MPHSKVFPKMSNVFTGIVLPGNRSVISSLCLVASLASHELVKLSPPTFPIAGFVSVMDIESDKLCGPGVPERTFFFHG